MSVLERIIAYKREEVAARKRAKPWRAIEEEAHSEQAMARLTSLS